MTKQTGLRILLELNSYNNFNVNSLHSSKTWSRGCEYPMGACLAWIHYTLLHGIAYLSCLYTGEAQNSSNSTHTSGNKRWGNHAGRNTQQYLPLLVLEKQLSYSVASQTGKDLYVKYFLLRTKCAHQIQIHQDKLRASPKADYIAHLQTGDCQETIPETDFQVWTEMLWRISWFVFESPFVWVYKVLAAGKLKVWPVWEKPRSCCKADKSQLRSTLVWRHTTVQSPATTEAGCASERADLRKGNLLWTSSWLKAVREAALRPPGSEQEDKRYSRHEAEAPCCTGEAYSGAGCPHTARGHCTEQISTYSDGGAQDGAGCLEELPPMGNCWSSFWKMGPPWYRPILGQF